MEITFRNKFDFGEEKLMVCKLHLNKNKYVDAL